MKLLIQRVKNASVTIDNKLYSAINQGMLVFVGIEKGDTIEIIEKYAKKAVNLRVFPDENGKMNRSLVDVNGEMLIVSQFTLCGDCRKGRLFDAGARRGWSDDDYDASAKRPDCRGAAERYLLRSSRKIYNQLPRCSRSCCFFS